MSSKTTNFNLHKIDLTDAPPDITVLNQNWDTLDTELKNTVDAITDAIDNHDDDTAAHYSIRNAMMPKAGGTMTGNLKISKANSPTIELQTSNSNGYTNISQHGGILTINAAMSNSSDDSFLTMSAPSDDDSDLVRIGKSVNNVNYYYKIYGEHNKPTPTDIGAVSKSGDTMSGNLIIKNDSPSLSLVDNQVDNTQAFSEIRKNASASVDYGTYISDYSGGTKDMLILARANELDQKLLLRVESEDGSTNTKYKVYGTHNTHAEISQYADLADIGLTAGSETIESIATRLPTYSRLIVTVGSSNNSSIYPNGNFGLLTVDKSLSTRILFTFTNNQGKQWVGVYAINSSGNTWTGWLTGGARIKTGSYVGTGESSVTLTLDPDVKFLYITGVEPYHYEIPTIGFVLPNAGTGTVVQPRNFTDIFGGDEYDYWFAESWDITKVNKSGNTVSWGIAAPTGSTYLNKSGITYHYVAIG